MDPRASFSRTAERGDEAEEAPMPWLHRPASLQPQDLDLSMYSDEESEISVQAGDSMNFQLPEADRVTLPDLSIGSLSEGDDNGDDDGDDDADATKDVEDVRLDAATGAPQGPQTGGAPRASLLSTTEARSPSDVRLDRLDEKKTQTEPVAKGLDRRTSKHSAFSHRSKASAKSGTRAPAVGRRTSQSIFADDDEDNRADEIKEQAARTASAGGGSRSLTCRQRAALVLSLHGQVVAFLCVYAVAVATIFTNFFLRKYYEKGALFPNDPHFDLKVVIPAVESANAHVMLFALALIPLTMCRLLISTLRGIKPLARVLPLNYTVAFHKLLGYQFGVQIVFTLAAIVSSVAALCVYHKRGEEPIDFCSLLRSEIALTGYGVFLCYATLFFSSLACIREGRPAIHDRLRALMTSGAGVGGQRPSLSVAPTAGGGAAAEDSAVRPGAAAPPTTTPTASSAAVRSHRYEIFYYAHHIFVALYVLLIIHTLDSQQREGKVRRSLTWKWLVGSLALYLFDRALIRLASRRTRVVSARLHYHPKSLVLDLECPAGWRYRSGQFLHLNVPSLSWLQWHPFSILSCPDEKTIRLCVRCEPGGWTNDLFEALLARSGRSRLEPTSTSASSAVQAGAALQAGRGFYEALLVGTEEAADLEIKVMGPFGAPSEDVRRYEHTVLVGSGTGIVSMVSTLRDVVNQAAASAAAHAPASGSHDRDEDEDEVDVVVAPELEHLQPASRGDEAAGAAAGEGATSSGSPRNGPPRTDRERRPRARDGTPESQCHRCLPAVAQQCGLAFCLLRKLEGLRYAVYNLVLLVGDLAFATALGVLFRQHLLTPERREIFDVAGMVFTGLYLVECPVRAAVMFRTGQRLTWKLAGLLDLVASVSMAASSVLFFLGRRPSPGSDLDCGLYWMFAAYRVIRRWATNPMTLIGSSGAWEPVGAVDAVGGRVRRIRFLWVVGSVSEFRWLAEELATLQRRADVVSPGLVDVRVYVTHPRANQAYLDRKVAGTGLEGRVTHGRPLLEPSLVELRRRLHEESLGGRKRVIRVGVFFSGNLAFQSEVRRVVATMTHTPRVKFLFHTENDDILWSPTRRVAQEVVPVA